MRGFVNVNESSLHHEHAEENLKHDVRTVLVLWTQKFVQHPYTISIDWNGEIPWLSRRIVGQEAVPFAIRLTLTCGPNHSPRDNKCKETTLLRRSLTTKKLVRAPVSRG